MEVVVRAAVRAGLLGRTLAEETAASASGAAALDEASLLAGIEEKRFAVLYDADAWESNLRVLREDAFGGAHFLHACAVKTNPLEWFLRRAQALGHGAECASVSEVLHALRIGFAPGDVVFDSPCKTVGEIRFALAKKVHLNVDNLQELDRVAAAIAMLGLGVGGAGEVGGVGGVGTVGTVGIRVNPLVGAGTIAAFSVSTGKSKFGVPLPAEGAEREQLVQAVLACPWVSCVHVHTGSGGMGLDQLVAGVRTAVDFALEVNERAGARQVRVLDMGGGLGVDYRSEDPGSAFAAYAARLREKVPEVFDAGCFDRVVSEFGAALQCKFGMLASRVEYTKAYDGGRIALIHAGSDVFMRACYCPETFVHHRVRAFDAEGLPKSLAPGEAPVAHDVAGPLCFAGDVVVRDAQLPALDVDDVIVLADVGGNSLSIRTAHCSRQAPAVHVYRSQGGEVTFETLQETQAVQDTLAQWACLPSSESA